MILRHIICYSARCSLSDVGPKARGEVPPRVSGDVSWGPVLLINLLGSVIYRLKQLGWGDELDRMQSLDYMPLREHTAYQPHQQLTDHGTFSA